MDFDKANSIVARILKMMDHIGDRSIPNLTTSGDIDLHRVRRAEAGGKLLQRNAIPIQHHAPVRQDLKRSVSP